MTIESTFKVGVYIDMHDYHNLEEDDGYDGMFYIHIKAKDSDAAMAKVMDDCVESRCPYTCEAHTAEEVVK